MRWLNRDVRRCAVQYELFCEPSLVLKQRGQSERFFVQTPRTPRHELLYG